MKTTPNKNITKKQQEVQRIIDVLSKAIAQHKLLPGQKLIEAQIVQALSANRNHVQTALQRLALQHIVTIEPNRGAFVAQPSAEEAKEIFAVRKVVEKGIIENIDLPGFEKNWDKINSHMISELEITQGEDRQAIVSKLCDYHKLLADLSGNSVLIEVFDNLMVRSSLIVALYQKNDIPSCQHKEHKLIIEALKQGDKEQAIHLMMEHLDHLEAELVLDDSKNQTTDIIQALQEL